MNDKQCEAICKIIDRVKNDERSLDTNEYAAMVEEAISSNASQYLAQKRWMPLDFMSRLADRVELDGLALTQEEQRAVIDNITDGDCGGLEDCTEEDWMMVDIILDGAIATTFPNGWGIRTKVDS